MNIEDKIKALESQLEKAIEKVGEDRIIAAAKHMARLK